MSFSKAKLKRFNEVPVGDSPSCTTSSSDKKDQIKKFLKDLKDSTKSDNKNDKEPKTPSAKQNLESDSESVKSSKSATMRLFRTPSLPHRLRFRQNSDVSTPKKELKKDVLKGKEALQAAQIEIKNKNEMLQEYTAQINESRTEINQLKENEIKIKTDLMKQLTAKDETIIKLMKDLQTARESAEAYALNEINLKIEKDDLTKQVKNLQRQIAALLSNHEEQINFLVNQNAELEISRDQIKSEQNKLTCELEIKKKEFITITEETESHKLALQLSDKKLLEKSLALGQLSIENANIFEEIQTIKKQMEDDLLSYAQESHRMLRDFENLKTERNKIASELLKKSELIRTLQEELIEKDIDLDSQRDEIRDSLQDKISNLTNQYENRIITLKEMNEMKVKEIESIHCFQIAEINREHMDNLTNINNDHQDELHRVNEIAEKKIQMLEIEHDQKIKELQKNINDSVQREKFYWKSEIDKCQKIAESEIIAGELEKQDLKTLLETAHEMLREREDKIKSFEGQVTNGIDYYVRLSEQLESQMNDVRQECARVMTEKYNYQLTLNNTRSTVNILMERLKKSDSDVEILKTEIEAVQNSKSSLETRNNEIEKELTKLKLELNEYKNALKSLRNSSEALKREMQEKEIVFEKLMTSEEETLETVNKIGKLFNERIEENIDKYFEMYVDLKRKYEARETYIKDMKSLLDEFAANIELARIELDTKDKDLLILANENKKIKFDNMTLKYRCEQIENEYIIGGQKFVVKAERDVEQQQHKLNDDELIINSKVIESVLADLVECEENLNIESCDKFETHTKLDQTQKIFEENRKLKDILSEQIRRNNLLQEIIDSENSIDIFTFKKTIEEKEEALKKAEKVTQEATEKYNELSNNQVINQNLKETNVNLKNKIIQLQNITKDQEATINALQDKVSTPSRKTLAPLNGQGTPRTPKTPKSLYFHQASGKENSPKIELCKSPKVLKPRN